MNSLDVNTFQPLGNSFSSFESEISDKLLRKTAECEENSEEKSSIKDVKALHLESSIMEWFKSKGIEAGNPSESLEALHTTTLKKIVSQKEQKSEKSSSLLNRRLKNKLTIA